MRAPNVEQGAVALISGGASGMGRIAAERWSEAGGVAVVADINGDALAGMANDRDTLVTRTLDVRDADAVVALVNEVEEIYGPIERVYNAAAIQPTELLLRHDLEEVHKVIDINYKGAVNVSLATLPRLIERGRGALVNFASIAGWIPNMHFGAYNAAKFALVAFTEVLHHENRGKGVDILCVCPGQVDTPLRSQATSQPKIMEKGPPPMDPALVIDTIEKSLGRNKLFVFPGTTTLIGWYLRRFAPGLLWRIDHNAEGH